MRKSLIAAVAVIVAALAMPAIGQADDVQSITANLSPAKRSKKKFKPAKIYVEILTQDSGQGTLPEQPPSATNTKVNFPKNARFNPKAVPRCKASEAQLQNTTTDHEGRASFTVTPRQRQATYRLRHPGKGATEPSATMHAVQVTPVVQAISLESDPIFYERPCAPDEPLENIDPAYGCGERATNPYLYGQVQPARDDVTVIIEQSTTIRESGPYEQLARTTTDAAGRYRIPMPARLGGIVRARVSEDTWHFAATSGTLNFFI